MKWIPLGGTAKRYENIITGESISYRQAIKRGLTKIPSLKVSKWIPLGGKAKRYENIITGETISYRQAIKRGLTKAPPLKVRFSTKNKTSRQYKNRKTWLQGKWQLRGTYLFERQVFEDQKKTERQLMNGYSFAGKKNYYKRHQEAVNYATAAINNFDVNYEELKEWVFIGIIEESWRRW